MDSIMVALLNFDHQINQWVTTIRSPTLTKIMYWATVSGRFIPVTILSIIVFFILIFKKKKEYIVPFLIAMPGGYGIMSLTKYIVGRNRPPNALFHVNGYSFPSGHAMMSTIFYLFILIAFYNDIRNSFIRFIFVILTITIPLLISFSRIYFNVHWATDVIGGILLGIIWLSISLSMK